MRTPTVLRARYIIQLCIITFTTATCALFRRPCACKIVAPQAGAFYRRRYVSLSVSRKSKSRTFPPPVTASLRGSPQRECYVRASRVSRFRPSRRRVENKSRDAGADNSLLENLSRVSASMNRVFLFLSRSLSTDYTSGGRRKHRIVTNEIHNEHTRLRQSCKKTKFSFH